MVGAAVPRKERFMSHASHRRASARFVLIGTLCLAVIAVGGGVAGAASPASPATDVQTARWVAKQLRFTYMGFTTHYSCDGLSDQVRSVLLQLGARPRDLKVHPVGCVRNLGRPEPSPSVEANFSVLEPIAGKGAASAGGASLAAHWRTVDVMLARSALDQAGQCELLEQVRQRIVPLFSTRNVRFRSNCVPHQLTLPGAVLKVEVLTADHSGRDLAAGH
jgi:hypothetical protein